MKLLAHSKKILLTLLISTLHVFSNGSFAAETNTAQDNHAIILLYHHVSEFGPATTSVTPKRFREHLQYLKDHNYQVWPLDKVIDSVFSDQPMPDKVVAITFDDSYRNIYTRALPILKEYNYPFTAFLDTEAISETADKNDKKNPITTIMG